METDNNLGTNQPNVGDVGSHSEASEASVIAVGSNSGASQPNVPAVGSNSGAIKASVTARGSNSEADRLNVVGEVGRLYEFSLEENWKKLTQFYNDGNAYSLLIPLTVAEDTAFHLAVYSGSDDPIGHLLEVAKRNPMIGQPYTMKNAFGNTVLHEAAANGNLKAVKLLVQHSPELVEEKNRSDATPIFRAAAYGQTEVMKFLASQPGQVTNKKLKEIHHYKTTARKKADAIEGEQKKVRDASILHAAIQGGHFETALELLKLDESLATLEDKNGATSLHLLATMPSAFRSGYRMSIWGRLFYICLPIEDEHEEDIKNENHWFCYSYLSKVSKSIKLLPVVKFFLQGWPVLDKILEEKRKHKLAFKLTRRLIKGDHTGYVLPTSSNEERDEELGINRATPAREDSTPIPLFLAAERGIIEIVNEMLKVCPQLVEQRDHLKRNILHVAIMHRRKEIFDRVKKMKIPMRRLVRGIDKNHYTILHHAADMENNTWEIHRGPAYHLQDELMWFRRVQKRMPSHFAMFRITEKDEHGKVVTCTCKELFNLKHKSLLKDAQKWIKETSQSCSAVAVLVATVVFAAAYTVPGGSNENGLPIFLNSPLFLFFTVMDVVALACSLTSVVMFLSVLTSPFKFENFLYSLPRKLTLGFTLLFLSLTTTMLAFTATILLIIHLEKPRWTTTLIYTASFLPVSIFALTQFPMFVAFTVTLSKLFKPIKKAIARRLYPLCRRFCRLFFKKNDDSERG